MRACEWPVVYSEVKYFKYFVYPTLPGKQLKIYVYIQRCVAWHLFQYTVNPNYIANVAGKC